RHGLHALRDTLQQDKELNTFNCSIGIVGVDYKFKIIEEDELQRFLNLLENVVDTEDIQEEEQGQAAPMDTEEV
ncbi:10867_t:CDS:1, partial [Dentiscutata erythropus]